MMKFFRKEDIEEIIDSLSIDKNILINKNIILPEDKDHINSVYHTYIIQSKKRDLLKKAEILHAALEWEVIR